MLKATITDGLQVLIPKDVIAYIEDVGKYREIRFKHPVQEGTTHVYGFNVFDSLSELADQMKMAD